MLEPGTNKRCINCNREFIDKKSHTRIQTKPSKELRNIVGDSNDEGNDATQASTEPVKHSLASVLFDKYDTCPYCGGKFFD